MDKTIALIKTIYPGVEIYDEETPTLEPENMPFIGFDEGDSEYEKVTENCKEEELEIVIAHCFCGDDIKTLAKGIKKKYKDTFLFIKAKTLGFNSVSLSSIKKETDFKGDTPMGCVTTTLKVKRFINANS